MKGASRKKKDWEKPAISILKIKRDTFSGAQVGPEGAGKTLPKKS